MKKIIILLSIFSFAITIDVFSQVIISNMDSNIADSSAMLEIKSNERGFLPPRMTLAERTAIKNPAEGLMVYCTNCGPNGSPAISVFMLGNWRNLVECTPPASPLKSAHIPCPDQVIWKWHPVPGATGYGWSASNDSVEFYLGPDTSILETGLVINIAYTRFVWSYSNCGISVSTILTEATSPDTLWLPVPSDHVPSSDQIVWNWKKVTGATGYKWGKTNNYLAATDMGTDTSMTETGLHCLTEYTRYIWAYNNCGFTEEVPMTTSTLDIPIASSPAEGTHISTITSVLWKWNPVAEAVGYKWNIYEDYSSALDLGTDTSFFEDSLVCGTQYTRYVWAYNGCGISAATVLSASTADEPPAAPDAKPHETSLDRITWHWSQVSGATGFKWYSVNDFELAADLGKDTLYNEEGLDCDSLFTRYVWTYNECGYSDPALLSMATLDDPPAAPDAATHMPSSDQVTWNWKQVAGANGYKWNATNDLQSALDIGPVTYYPETGLDCWTEYNRYVWAYGDCGTSASRLLTDSTLMVPINTPPVEGIHNSTLSSVQWRWHPVCDTCRYKWSITDQFSTADDKGTDTTFTEINLDCGTQYTRYIWAYNDCGYSASTVITMNTSSAPPDAPLPATHMTAPGQITWNWNQVANAAGYLWNTVDDTSTAIDMGPLTTRLETGLDCQTEYTRYIWAYHDCGNSTVMPIKDTTLDIPMTTPPEEGIHVPGSTSIQWKWHNLSDTCGYKWNASDDYSSAIDLETDTSYTENNLVCLTNYIRYIWAYDDCGFSPSAEITAGTLEQPPAAPLETVHEHTATQITWKWNPVAGVTGYKWHTSADFANATVVGTDTSHLESGLVCDTYYTRYVWSFNNCGHSVATTLTHSTIVDTLDAPSSGVHVPSLDQIIWNWNTVEGATGYKWSSADNYPNAIDVGNSTTKIENGLTCSHSYTRYIWAYDQCGHSLVSTVLTQSTVNCWACGDPITVVHVTDNVAPVDKTVNYNTVTNVPGELSKCWITQNLGSDHQATSVNDNTEASAGWYWQFNRPRGFKHDGTTRTPATTWTPEINEFSDWLPANDPCAIEIGAGWRIPTISEWTNVDAGGPWTNWNHPFGSLLKMHASGRLYYNSGNLSERGQKGSYWSTVQYGVIIWAQMLSFSSSTCVTSSYDKSYGYPVRCVHNGSGY